MIDNDIKGNEMENEFTTDAVLGIMPRNYEDTLVTREIPNNYGYYNEAGEYVENGTFTITHYQYAHNPMVCILMKINTNIRLDDYQIDYFEQAITRVFLCVLGLTQLSEL